MKFKVKQLKWINSHEAEIEKLSNAKSIFDLLVHDGPEADKGPWAPFDNQMYLALYSVINGYNNIILRTRWVGMGTRHTYVELAFDDGSISSYADQVFHQEKMSEDKLTFNGEEVRDWLGNRLYCRSNVKGYLDELIKALRVARFVEER